MHTRRILYGALAAVFALALFTIADMPRRMEIITAITRADPLLYAPEIDPAKLSEATDTLLAAEDRLIRTIESGLKEKYAHATKADSPLVADIAEEGFLPGAYLAALPHAIEGTGDFLAKPTILGAYRMLVRDRAAARRYAAESERFAKLMQRVRSIDTAQTPLVFLASQTNTAILLSDAQDIARNGEMLERETRWRLMCFLIGACGQAVHETAAHADAAFAEKNSSPDKLPPIEPLPPRLVAFSPLQKPEQGKDTDISLSPRYFFIESGCFPAPVVPFYLIEGGDHHFLPKQADTNYYADFRALLEMSPGNSYSEYFLSRDVSYGAQREGSSYRCPDLAYWGDLATMNRLAVHMNRDIASVHDLAVLREEFARAPDKETYVHIIDNRLVDLPLMLAALTSTIDIETDSMLSRKSSPVSSLYLLGIQSAYSLTYHTFSRSIWRSGERPMFFSQRNTGLPPAVTTYHELRERFSDEEIMGFRANPRESFVQIHEAARK